MKQLKGFKFALPLFILAVLLHHPISAHAITQGLVGNYPANDIKLFLPLAKYLSQELRAEGVTEGKILVAQDINEFASFFREGKVDLHLDSYVRALALNRLVGTKLLLRRWKKAGEARRRIGELIILEETPSVPRHIVGARADIPAQRLSRIKEILIRMGLSEEGRKILHDLESTTKFDELTEQNVTLLPKLRNSSKRS
jgi:ABC-type phosphate/phosphonate transport system substrate-binding protein